MNERFHEHVKRKIEIVIGAGAQSLGEFNQICSGVDHDKVK